MPRRKVASTGGRKPKTAALYKGHVHTNHGHRSVRVAAYIPNEEQTTGIIFGIGYSDPESYARIVVELTREEWKQIQLHVKRAFAAADRHIAVTAAERAKVNPKPPQVGKGRPITSTRQPGAVLS